LDYRNIILIFVKEIKNTYIMKISELIVRLQAHPNQEAEINLFTNVINTDEESFDEEAELNIISEDSFYDDFVDIIITPKIIKDEADIENNIHRFLRNDFSNLTIEIDVNDGIFITDKDGGILRETEFSNDWIDGKDEEEIINEIVLKLRKML
jgi:hypothetical protein